jgi:hypothetical protein
LGIILNSGVSVDTNALHKSVAKMINLKRPEGELEAGDSTIGGSTWPIF